MDDTERSRCADDRATLDDPVFSELFDAMRTAASGPAPAMGPELTALVSGAGVASLTGRRTRVRTAIVSLAVLGAVAGGAGAAAAAGVSPSQAARFATTIIQRMPGVDSGGDTGVDEDKARTVEERVSPATTSGEAESDDERRAGREAATQVSPTHPPSQADDDESRQTSGVAADDDEHASAAEPSSTDTSGDVDDNQARPTDTDERTTPSTTGTEDDAYSETGRDTDDGSSQEQSDD
jgi:hypothetical protein